MNKQPTPQEVAEQGIADWLAERASESRSQAELMERVAAYCAELKAIEAANQPAPEPDAPLPLPRIGWLDMVLAVFRGR